MIKKILGFLTLIIVLFSCRDDNFGNGNNLEPVNFTVNLKYDASLDSKPASGANVILTNNNTGDIYNATSDTNGAAKFIDILPGSYNIAVTKNMNQTEFQMTFGFSSSNGEIIFNGNQDGATANANVNSTEVILTSAKIGGLVIKQISYAGSNAAQGALFRDQFIEIFNNSDQIIYADGLYIGQLYGKTNTTVASHTLSNGQYDWSQSLGMTMGNSANTDYVYADYVFQIPGTGTQYPIQPGQSIVIAQSAINHKSPLVDNNGDPINIGDPSLTVDLSTAEFESYLGDFRQSIGEPVYQWDIQNPAVQDLNIAYWGIPGWYNGNKDFIMDGNGRDSFIIFRSNNFSNYDAFTDPSVTNVSTNSKYFLQIPNTDIIDAVELQHYNPSKQRPKMLNAAFDASSIKCDAAYNSQSVVRKIKTTTKNGRVILEDTNNSAQDFQVIKANPKGFN